MIWCHEQSSILTCYNHYPTLYCWLFFIPEPFMTSFSHICLTYLLPSSFMSACRLSFVLGFLFVFLVKFCSVHGSDCSGCELPLFVNPLQVCESQFWGLLQMGQIKLCHLPFLLLAVKCVYKIQWFLAYTDCLNQQVVLCEFYLRESITS